MEEIRIKVSAFGSYTEDELKDYIIFSLGFGSIDPENPFIDEDSDAVISDIDID